jgi:putative ABC transport system permease protein
LMTISFQDLKYAMRTLARSPGFTLVAVITLALGIGANTAIFSVVNGVLLTPLRYEEPDRLVRLFYRQHWHVTAPAFIDYRDMIEGFESVAAIYNYREWGQTLTGRGPPRRVTALPISAEFFDVYGVLPIIGRTFHRDEERVSSRVVVLSHRLWTALSGGDPSFLGQSVILDGQTWTVIGIMPETFLDLVGGDVDLWVPQELRAGTHDSPVTSTVWNQRDNHYLNVIARLGPGVSLEEAQAQLDALNANQAALNPDTDLRLEARVVPFYDEVIGSSNTMLYILLGAAALVLLIACVNVANLILSRNISRERELAIRTALGSGRPRLIRQLLTESLVIAVAGGTAGLILAYWGVKGLLTLSPDSIPRVDEVAFNAPLFSFALAVTLLTGIVFGLAPALQSANPNLDRSLRDSTRGSTVGMRTNRMRSVLVTSQVCLALILLVAAGLLMRSLVALQQVDLGIAPQHTMTLEVDLPDSRYPEPAQQIAFHHAFADRVTAIPGVETVGAISRLPVTGQYNSWGFGYMSSEGEVVQGGAEFRIIEGGYFAALNITLLAGRFFERSDGADAPPVTIINESTARRYFGDRDPVGQEILREGRRWRIIGVVQDVAQDHRGNVGSKVYLPHAQYVDRNWALTQVIATTTHREDLLDLVSLELAAIDPGLVLHNARWMRDVMASVIARDKFALVLMTMFAGVALCLASVGIYGVLAYSVNQRTREIGIRMALGADSRKVRWAVIRQGASVVAAGIVAGLAGALALSVLLESMLFGISVRDPFTFAVVPLALSASAGLAGYLPARRATRVNPVEALRQE